MRSGTVGSGGTFSFLTGRSPSCPVCGVSSAFSAAMAKRNADKELTDRNWDQEEEGEEVGGASEPADEGELVWDQSA